MCAADSRTLARALSVVLLTALLATRAARADPDAPPVGDAYAACDPDSAARLRFLEARLDERRTWADRWWKGWTGGYAIGTVAQSVRAGLEDDDGRQADYVVSAVKALFGTVRLALSAPSARVGADPMRSVSVDSTAGCRERLAVGERLLRRSAEESASRWSWKRHLANVAINVAGGVIVAEGFDESRGWTSMGIGIAVGEAMTLSHPWTGDDDLAEYERRFTARRAAAPAQLRMEPWGRGLRLTYAF